MLTQEQKEELARLYELIPSEDSNQIEGFWAILEVFGEDENFRRYFDGEED